MAFSFQSINNFLRVCRTIRPEMKQDIARRLQHEDSDSQEVEEVDAHPPKQTRRRSTRTAKITESAKNCSADWQLDRNAILPHCKSTPFAVQKTTYEAALATLAKHSGVVIATDTGTGKTLLALSLLMHEVASTSHPISLAILVKTPLMSHWEREINKHVDTWGQSQFNLCKQVPVDKFRTPNTIYVVNTCSASTKEFLAVHWRMVVVEEAHTFSNLAQYFNAIFSRLKCEKRVLLTATPQKSWRNISKMMNFCEVAPRSSTTEVFLRHIGNSEMSSCSNASAHNESSSYSSGDATSSRASRVSHDLDPPVRAWDSHFRRGRRASTRPGRGRRSNKRERLTYEDEDSQAEDDEKQQQQHQSEDPHQPEDMDEDHALDAVLDCETEVRRMAFLLPFVLTGSSLKKKQPVFKTIVCEAPMEVQAMRKAFDGFEYDRSRSGPIWRRLMEIESPLLPEQQRISLEELHRLCKTKRVPGIIFNRRTDDCAICCQPFTNPRVTECGHVFCLECWKEWCNIGGSVKGTVQCPSCRKKIQARRGTQTWHVDFDKVDEESESTNESKDSRNSGHKQNQMSKRFKASVPTPPPPPPQPPASRTRGGRGRGRGGALGGGHGGAGRGGKKKNGPSLQVASPNCKATCLTANPKLLEWSKMKEVKKALGEFLLKHSLDQVLVYTKIYLFAKILQRHLESISTPTSRFMYPGKTCGFSRVDTNMEKANRRIQLFNDKRIQVLFMDTVDFASGHDFHFVPCVMIVDFDTVLHLFQARQRAGCARIVSNIDTEVYTFVHRNSLEEFVVNYLDQEKKLDKAPTDPQSPCFRKMLELEYFMFQSVFGTRMNCMKQKMEKADGCLPQFKGGCPPTVQWTLPNRDKETHPLTIFN